MTYGRIFKASSFISYLLFIINCQRLLSASLFQSFHSLFSPPNHSPITPQLLPVQIVLQFKLQVLILFSRYICRPEFLSLDCWSCAVKILPRPRGWRIEPSFIDSSSCSRYFCSEWTLENISQQRSIWLTLQPQTTKISYSTTESRDTSSSTYYPPQVFQPRQQNLTTEGHHPYHNLFYQILLQWIWKNMDQEVHLHHTPRLLLQYFFLSWP